MSSLALSCKNLINSNNGSFKSDKQKAFMLSQAVDGIICESGSSYKNNWLDMYYLDESGVVEWVRENNNDNSVSKWKRDGSSSEQIKLAKRVAKYEAKLASHKKLEQDLYPEFVKFSIDNFGYVVDDKKMTVLRGSISEYKANIVNVVLGLDKNNADVMQQFGDMYKQLMDLEEIAKDICAKMSEYRIKVSEIYNLDYRIEYLSDF